MTKSVNIWGNWENLTPQRFSAVVCGISICSCIPAGWFYQCSWVSRAWTIRARGGHNTNLFVHSLPPLHIPCLRACMHICTHTRLYTQWGETALHIAVREERDDIVELLLEANADPDLPVKVIHTYHTWQSWWHEPDLLYACYELHTSLSSWWVGVVCHTKTEP